jgi:hypothetical protein
MYVKYKGNRRKVNADAQGKQYITLDGKKLYLSKIASKIEMVQRGGCTINQICTTDRINSGNQICASIVKIPLNGEQGFAKYQGMVEALQRRASSEGKLLYQITEVDESKFMYYMMSIRINYPGTELHMLGSDTSTTNIGFILMPQNFIQNVCSRQPSPNGPFSFTSSSSSTPI